MTSIELKSITDGIYKYTQQLIYCGKSTCRRCPHGPYWYLSFTLRDGRKVKKYVGKNLPPGLEQSC